MERPSITEIHKIKRNSFFDIAKGICIILVICTHFRWGEEYKQILGPLWIDMAVPVFMIISGYTLSMSFTSKGIGSLEQGYSFQMIKKRFLLYTVPWLLACLVELPVCLFEFHEKGFGRWCIGLLRGGYGPGSYYYPILIQMIFVFPVIFIIIRKLDIQGVMLCFLFNFFYEVIQNVYGMGESFYRLCLLRYFFCIAFGSYLYLGKKAAKIWVYICGFFTGLGYILLIQYTSYQPKLFIWWSGTSMMAALYVCPVFKFFFEKLGSRVHCRPLEYIGKCSYDIYLVQMVWFWHAQGVLIYMGVSKYIIFWINLVVCISMGIIFHFVESFITLKVLDTVR